MELSVKRPIRVREYFAALENHEKDVVENLLDEDFTFTSPSEDHINKDEFLARLWDKQKSITSFEIKELITNDDEAFVTYEATMASGEHFQNTEIIKFRDEKIEEVKLYYGELPPTIH